jgi:hypothetical protein
MAPRAPAPCAGFGPGLAGCADHAVGLAGLRGAVQGRCPGHGGDFQRMVAGSSDCFDRCRLGGVATWGGLADIPPPDESPRPPSSDTNKGKWGRGLFKAVLTVALIPRQDRKKALEVFGGEVVGQDPEPALQEDLEVSWQKYRDDITDNADRNRVYLHASRVLGVFAAVFIAVLAVVAVVAGTVAPAASDVIVVHHGQLTCGPVSDNTKYTDVTNVVPVTSC